MRVLHFYTTYYPDSLGGIEQVIRQLCKGTGKLTLAWVISVPNTARICSKRMAASRPRFSPASVITEKLGE